ncbi:MAG: hypothetical protein ACRDGO_03045, partial [Actinomycetota bacterium]
AWTLGILGFFYADLAHNGLGDLTGVIIGSVLILATAGLLLMAARPSTRDPEGYLAAATTALWTFGFVSVYLVVLFAIPATIGATAWVLAQRPGGLSFGRQVLVAIAAVILVATIAVLYEAAR